MEKTLTLRYEQTSLEALAPSDRQLIAKAQQAAHTAYNPYSHFYVGAALRLADGTIVTGSNQENMAYPSGLCAERTALFSAGAQHPGTPIEALAVVGAIEALGEGSPLDYRAASPCGACRQVMCEYERKQARKMRILLYHNEDQILVFDSAEALLPFAFDL